MRIWNGKPAPLSVDHPAPIRSHVSRGFVIGWLAIIVAVACGFMLATGSLNHSTADVRIAQIGTETISPRS